MAAPARQADQDGDPWCLKVGRANAGSSLPSPESESETDASREVDPGSAGLLSSPALNDASTKNGETAQLPHSVRSGGSKPEPIQPVKSVGHSQPAGASADIAPAIPAPSDQIPAAATSAALSGATQLGAAPVVSHGVTSTGAEPDAAGKAALLAPAAVTPPATQLGHAVAALRIGADGSSNLSIRLDPAELGQVQVHIVRGQDGASSVSVAVERAETLGRLQADLTHLHLALDRAGVPEQRSLVLHLAPRQDANTNSFSDQASAGWTSGGQSSGDQSHAGQNRQGSNPQSAEPQPVGAHAQAAVAEAAEPIAAQARGIYQVATGINITA